MFGSVARPVAVAASGAGRSRRFTSPSIKVSFVTKQALEDLKSRTRARTLDALMQILIRNYERNLRVWSNERAAEAEVADPSGVAGAAMLVETTECFLPAAAEVRPLCFLGPAGERRCIYSQFTKSARCFGRRSGVARA